MFGRLTDKILDRVEDVILREAEKTLTPHIQNAASELLDSIVNEAPKAISTGGSTAVYLEQIQEDFRDFHADDAVVDIQTFMLEFFDVKYGKLNDFEKARVSEKVKINVGPKSLSRLSNIQIHQIAIKNYEKSLNSATIVYRVSAGFVLGGTRREKLYEVTYTLQLRDEYGEQKFLQCHNCGAPLEESSGECLYCGMKTIRDTISNWFVTNIKEIK